MRRLGAPGAIFLAATLFHVVQGLTIPLPWVLPDELRTVDAARALVDAGRGGPWSLYALLTAPLWWLSTGTAYALAKIIGAIALSAAAFPAYRLARMVASPRGAAVAAAGAVAAPGTLVASAALPVALAYPLAVGGLLLLVRLLNGARTGTRAFVLLALAALVWPPLLWLLGGAAAVAFVRRVGWAALREWPGAGAIVVATAVVYPALLLARSGSHVYDVAFGRGAHVVRGAVGSVGALSLGLGLLPLALALAAVAVRRRADPPWPALLTVLLTALVSLAAAAGFEAAGLRVAASETALLPLLPLVLAAAVGVVEGPAKEWGALGLGAGVALVSALSLPSDGFPLRAPGLAFAHLVGLRPWLAALGLAAATALVLSRSLRLAVLLAAGVLGAGSLAAGWEARSSVAAAARLVPDALPAAARSGELTVLPAGTTKRVVVNEILFWNGRAVVVSPPLERRTVDQDTGLFVPPLEPKGLLLDLGGARTDGELLAVTPLAALLRPHVPAHTVQTVAGLFPDGWSGSMAVFRRFAGAPVGGTVKLTISRQSWTGTDRPGTVLVDTGPVGGEPTGEQATVIHAGQLTVLDLAVPPPPFQVRVTISPTFAPSEFGAADKRQLGAVLGFAYTPSA